MKPFNENNTQDIEFKNKQALHGDVIVEKLTSLPEDFSSLEKEPNDALAYGEHTGHLHKLFRIPDIEGADLPTFQLKVGKDGFKYLKVESPVVLKHQEHEPRVVPKGFYKIGVQREYDVWAKVARSVRD